MPAKSKSQQKLFGMVHAYQKGELKKSEVNSDELWQKIKNIADEMDEKDVEDFVSIKHKNLPDKVKKENYNMKKSELRKLIQEEIQRLNEVLRVSAKDLRFVEDQLINSWEYSTKDEMFKHLVKQTRLNKIQLENFVEAWYNNDRKRNETLKDFSGDKFLDWFEEFF